MADATTPAGAPPAPDLHGVLGEVSSALLRRVPAFAAHGTEVMRAEVPEYYVADDDVTFVEVHMQSFFANLLVAFEGLALVDDAEVSELPPMSRSEAEIAAELGISLDGLLQIYRIAHRLVLSTTVDEVYAVAPGDAARDAALRAASAWYFRYFDQRNIEVADAYQHARDAQVRSRERQRRQLVRGLLSGTEVDTRSLGYDLDLQHVGVVAWGAQPEQALSRIAAAAGMTLLTTPGTDATAWGWLGASGDAAVIDAERALPDDTRISLGEPAPGVDGFRRTHFQAVEAYRVARLGPSRPVTTFFDVGLIAITTQDPAQARDFVASELGPLADRQERSAQLRETVRVYFESGQNAVACAARLGIHDRTVAYRVRQVEELLGRPVTRRSQELVLAARLFDALNADDA